MKSVNSQESNKYYFNISNEATNIVENEYKNDNIIYAIEEISNEYSTNKYPILTQTMNELFIIYENNKEFIVNYYSKIDKSHNTYLLKEINNINELNKASRIFTFVKNYAIYNDDKKLKALLNKKN
jgi:hypothetical protein